MLSPKGFNASGPLGVSAYNGSIAGDRASSYFPTNNTWIHYVVTVNSTGYVTVYANGVSVFGSLANALRTTPRSQMYVGKSAWDVSTDPLFSGLMSTLQISNGYVFTPADALALYQNGGCPTAPPGPPPSPPQPPSPPSPPPLPTACSAFTHSYVFSPAYASGTTLQDQSGTWPGTIYGSAAFSTDGPLSGYGSLVFDGSTTYVSLGNRTFGGGTSVALWAKTYLSASAVWTRFFDFSNGISADNFLLSPKGFNASGPLGVSVYNGATSGDRASSYFPANNTWIHYVVTVNSTGYVTVYANGVSVFGALSNALRSVPRSQMYIGKSPFADPLFYGLVSTLQIANSYAFTAADALALYQNGGCPSAPAPAGRRRVLSTSRMEMNSGHRRVLQSLPPAAAVVPGTCLGVALLQTAPNGAQSLMTPLVSSGPDAVTFALSAGSFVINATLVDWNGLPRGSNSLLPFTLLSPPAALGASPPPPPLLGSILVNSVIDVDLAAYTDNTIASVQTTVQAAVTAAATAIGGTAAGVSVCNVSLAIAVLPATNLAPDGTGPSWTRRHRSLLSSGVNLAALNASLGVALPGAGTPGALYNGDGTWTIFLNAISDTSASNVAALANVLSPPSPAWFNGAPISNAMPVQLQMQAYVTSGVLTSASPDATVALLTATLTALQSDVATAGLAAAGASYNQVEEMCLVPPSQARQCVYDLEPFVELAAALFVPAVSTATAITNASVAFDFVLVGDLGSLLHSAMAASEQSNATNINVLCNTMLSSVNAAVSLQQTAGGGALNATLPDSYVADVAYALSRLLNVINTTSAITIATNNVAPTLLFPKIFS